MLRLLLSLPAFALNTARLASVPLRPIVSGRAVTTGRPLAAAELWKGQGAVIFAVRRAG
jgi:hypothetical protein